MPVIENDPYIGTTFTTPKGSTLTVVDDNGLKSDKKKYILICSICSKDEELWPYGSIQMAKSTLKRGGINCSCGNGTVYWTEEQNNVRVKRSCKDKGLVFHGWYGEYKGWKTYLKLHNPATNNTWNTTRLDGLINKGTYDPSLQIANAHKVIAKEYNDERQIKDFIESGGYLKDTIFWKSDRETNQGRKGYWFYKCPICSNDKYVEKGLCTGVFEILDSSAKKGQKSCRCSPRYRWTNDQMNLKASDTAKARGWEIISVRKDTINGKLGHHYITYRCNDGHINEKTSNMFFREDAGCPDCSKYGFDKTKEGIFYIVEWYGYCESYLKFGITNRDVMVRIEEQSDKSTLDYKILHTFEGNGNDVWNVESKLKKQMDTRKCPKKWLPNGYTETVENTEENLMYILKECLELVEVHNG